MPESLVRSAVAGCLFLLLVVVGCQPTVDASFELSEQVRELGADAESEEERQLWQDLQAKIADELTQRCGTPQRPRRPGAPDSDLSHLKRGAAVYARRCQMCHGVSGDGNGPVAKYLDPRPRDYRPGIFKFTTTPYGAKPRRTDLLRTVRRGVTGTSMPSFDDLSSDDLEAVVDYVVVLSQRGELETQLALLAYDEEDIDSEYVDELVAEILDHWTKSQENVVAAVTPMPPMTPESVSQGHRLFLKYACNKCHGKDGRGGSLGNVDVGTDVWGHKAAAADLTSGMFRGGERPIDIYRRIIAGINGTPMPSFGDTFANDPDAIWRLVHFVQDTGQRRRQNLPPIDAETIQAIERELEQGSAPEPAGALPKIPAALARTPVAP